MIKQYRRNQRTRNDRLDQGAYLSTYQGAQDELLSTYQVGSAVR